MRWGLVVIAVGEGGGGAAYLGNVLEVLGIAAEEGLTVASTLATAADEPQYATSHPLCSCSRLLTTKSRFTSLARNVDPQHRKIAAAIAHMRQFPVPAYP